MMRYWILSLLFAFPCSLFGTSSIYAGPHHNYTRIEYNNPHRLEGFLTGVTAGYLYQCQEWNFQLQYEGYWSLVDIYGHPCQSSQIQEHLAFLKAGWTLACGRCFCVTPFVGGGFNAYRNEQDPVVSALTYRWRKWTVPVGVEAYWKYSDSFGIGFLAEWRPDVYSRLKVIGDTYHSEKKDAFRVEIPFLFCFGCQNPWSIQVVPFYDWNQFGEVKKKNEHGVSFPLPTLIRWDAGVRFLLAFAV